MSEAARKENQEDCYQGTEPNADWGLSLIEGYGLRWDILYSYDAWQSWKIAVAGSCLAADLSDSHALGHPYSKDWGLPQSRPRAPSWNEGSAYGRGMLCRVLCGKDPASASFGS